MLTVKVFTFNPVEENTYVLYNEKKECCIIDPGFIFLKKDKSLKDLLRKTSFTPFCC